MDAVTLALSKKFTKKTLSGMSPIKGQDGPTGPAGPKGPTGDAGIKGDTGDAGPKGPTGNAGPKGPKGDTGDSGPQGIAGPDGAQGLAGPDGAKGAAGPKGPDGAQGVQGQKGPDGEPFRIKKVYDTVSDMNAGYATDGVPAGELAAINSVTGGADGGHLYKKGSTKYEFFYDIGQVNGLAGPAGPAGPTGPIGPKGIPGVDGAKGATGDKGPVGAKGLKGDTGDEGPKGAKGDTGAAGAQGPKGESGDVGPKGPKGDSGADGPKGEPGDDGALVTINGKPTKTIQAGANVTIDKSGSVLTINATGGGGGGGGIYPVVVITTEPATAGVTFTMTNGISTFIGTTDDTGMVEIEFDDLGKWTISTTFNGKLLEDSFYAESVKIYNFTFSLFYEWSPKMKSDNEPAPYVASASSAYSNSFAAWMAFDGSPVTDGYGAGGMWISKDGLPSGYIQIDIGSPISVAGMKINPVYSIYGVQSGKNFYVSGSNDGSDWKEVFHTASVDWASIGGYTEFMFENIETYRYWRIGSHDTTDAYANRVSYGDIQFLRI